MAMSLEIASPSVGDVVKTCKVNAAAAIIVNGSGTAKNSVSKLET